MFNVLREESNKTQQVVLPYVDLMKLNETNFEPQEVTIKNPVSSWIYLTNFGLNTGLGTQVTLNANGQVIFEKVSRISPIAFQVQNPGLPNINVRNNNVVFYSSVTSTKYSVFLPEDLYGDSFNIVAALIDALNSVTGSSGLTFSYTGLDLKNLITLTATGGTFYIDPTCNAVTKGILVYGFNLSTALVSSILVGPINGISTSYIDVQSYTLTKYAKLRSIATNRSLSGIFLRVFLDLSGLTTTAEYLLTSSTSPSNNFAFKSKETVNNIDITLYDMYGDVLYVPDYYYNKFIWTLTIAVQI